MNLDKSNAGGSVEIAFLLDRRRDIAEFLAATDSLRTAFLRAKNAYQMALEGFIKESLLFDNEDLIKSEVAEFGLEYIDYLSRPNSLEEATQRIEFWIALLENQKSTIECEYEELELRK